MSRLSEPGTPVPRRRWAICKGCFLASSSCRPLAWIACWSPVRRKGPGMVIGGAARLGIADQYGSAHAAPTGLIGLVVLVAVVVAVILSRRGQ